MNFNLVLLKTSFYAYMCPKGQDHSSVNQKQLSAAAAMLQLLPDPNRTTDI